MPDSRPTPPRPAVPEPTPADLGRDAAADYSRMVDPYCSLHPQEIRGYARLWITLGVHYRAALDAERRRAEVAEARVRELTGGTVKALLTTNDLQNERDCLAAENAVLRQEVAGLQKSADQLRADLRTAAERVAAQSELLSRRADRPT